MDGHLVSHHPEFLKAKYTSVGDVGAARTDAVSLGAPRGRRQRPAAPTVRLRPSVDRHLPSALGSRSVCSAVSSKQATAALHNDERTVAAVHMHALQ